MFYRSIMPKRNSGAGLAPPREVGFEKLFLRHTHLEADNCCPRCGRHRGLRAPSNLHVRRSPPRACWLASLVHTRPLAHSNILWFLRAGSKSPKLRKETYRALPSTRVVRAIGSLRLLASRRGRAGSPGHAWITDIFEVRSLQQLKVAGRQRLPFPRRVMTGS